MSNFSKEPVCKLIPRLLPRPIDPHCFSELHLLADDGLPMPETTTESSLQQIYSVVQSSNEKKGQPPIEATSDGTVLGTVINTLAQRIQRRKSPLM